VASISGLATPAAHARSARRCSTRCSPAMAHGHQDAGPVASDEFLCGAVCGDATARTPRPHADLRRTTPLADPGRVRAALQRASPPPVAGTTTAAARARPADRYDHPDYCKHTSCRPRPDQRVPESGLTSTGNARSEPACEFWHGTGGGLSGLWRARSAHRSQDTLARHEITRP